MDKEEREAGGGGGGGVGLTKKKTKYVTFQARKALQASAIKNSPPPPPSFLKKKITSYVNGAVQICRYVFRNLVGFTVPVLIGFILMLAFSYNVR